MDALLVFKYYVHDTAAGYSLQMFGPLTETSLPELSCCWQTAKATLGNRTLTLDLRALTSVDDKSKLWLASMNEQGANCIPASFMRDECQTKRLDCECDVETAVPAKRGLFGRISATIRGFA